MERKMTAATHESKRKRKRIWRSIVTTLAAIVVFVTTYALIIPAITWESTLICEIEEHVHSAGCYDEEGALKCGKQAHTHTDVCFDAPKAIENPYTCIKAEHVHSEDCYFPDGKTLKCTLEEHVHTPECKYQVRTVVSEPAADGAEAVICGLLPAHAQAEIRAVPLGMEELTAYFGFEKAAKMTGFVAYDIRITVDGQEWQPNESVSVTVRHPEIETGGTDRLNLAHVKDGAESVTDVTVLKNAKGEVSFKAESFSLYIFYTSFTVDFYYKDSVYHLNGTDSVTLGDLFENLGIAENAADAVMVSFTDETLVSIEKNEAGEWVLTSHKAFDTHEKLTVLFGDGRELNIATTDAVFDLSTTVAWEGDGIRITVIGTKGTDEIVPMDYSFSGVNYGPTVRLDAAGSGSSSFVVSAALTEDLVPGDETLTDIKVGSTVIADSMTELLDLIERPASRSVSFGNWLNFYSGAKATVSELFGLFGSYYNGGDYPIPTAEKVGKTGTSRKTQKTLLGAGAFDPSLPPDEPVVAEDEPAEVTLTKQIDYLGDNGEEGMEDLYRLYLTLQTEAIEPMDLLLIIDQSGSMESDLDDNPPTTETLYFNVHPADFAYDDDFGCLIHEDEATGYILGYDVYGDDDEWVYIFEKTYEDWWPLDFYDPETGEGEVYGFSDIVLLDTEFDLDDFAYDPVYGCLVYRDDETGYLLGYDAYGDDDKWLYCWIELEQYWWPFDDYELKTGHGTVIIDDTDVIDTVIDLDDFAHDPDYECLVYRDDETGYLLGYGVYSDDDYDDKWLYCWIESEGDWYPFDDFEPKTGEAFAEMWLSVPNPEFSGISRQQQLLDFLNGKEEDNSDGFINIFREANDENRLAVLTFSDDCGLDQYIMEWNDTDLSIHPPAPYGATNYAAALTVADQVLDYAEDSPNRKVVIFLSDGAPTIAYADGHLHTGYDEDVNGTFSVGSGNNYSKQSLSSAIGTYISYMTNGGMMYNTWEDYLTEYNNGYRYVEIDTDVVTFPNAIWPLTYDITTIGLTIPGTLFPEFGYDTSVENYEAKFNAFKELWASSSSEEQREWIMANLTNPGKPGTGYDLFYLSESAFSEFATMNSDVPVFTLFFVGDGDLVLPSGRVANQVLKYMSGDDHSHSSTERFHHYQVADSAESLANAIKTITGLSGVHIEDPLSEYVDVADEPKLEITFSNEAYEDEYEPGKNYAILYQYDPVTEEYGFTELGEKLLDVESTKIDPATRTLDVFFDSAIFYTGEFKCEASFNVRVNETAIETYMQNGNNYAGVTGDADTDHLPNNTSSNQPGFHSNDTATAEWNYYGVHDDTYKDPVVQLYPTDIELIKINQAQTPISGAEFDLFRVFTVLTDDCENYTDPNGVTYSLFKINSAPLISDKDNPIEVDDLLKGTYYLFETKAPNGYISLTDPIKFTLDSEGITTSDTANAVIPSGNLMQMKVINRSSSDLPATGGGGIRVYYVIGALLTLGALTIGHIVRRRREGRGET